MSLNHAVMQAMLCDVEFAEYLSLHFFHIPGWSICHDRILLIQCSTNVQQKDDLTQLMMSHEEGTPGSNQNINIRHRIDHGKPANASSTSQLLHAFCHQICTGLLA